MDILLENYFMKPIHLNKIPLYPVKMFLYDEFSTLINGTILLSIPNLNKRLRQGFQLMQKERKIPKNEEFVEIKQETLFEFIKDECNQYYKDVMFLDKIVNLDDCEEKDKFLENPLIQHKMKMFKEGRLDGFLKSMTSLIEIIVNEQEYSYYKQNGLNVINKVNFDGDRFIIENGNDILGYIDDSNFELFRETIMKQNMLHEPMVGYDYRSQQRLDRALAKKNGKSNYSKVSVISTVKGFYNITDEELINYTQYRLMYDYHIACRRQDQLMKAMFMCAGSNDNNIPSLSDDVVLFVNPYEGLFIEEGQSGLESAIKG